MAELSLWLDSYNDIYSDFDARTLLKRRISEDFIHELELAYHRREENTNSLALQVPASLRIETDEKLITERVSNYFNREYENSARILKSNSSKNLVFLGVSIIIMVINVILTLRPSESGRLNAWRILLEPAGWFFFWNSLEYFFYDRSIDSTRTKFWNTVAGWKILFKSY